MRHLAGFALSWAAIFLTVVAILIGSRALFYITTALIATIGACHLQAWLSVRSLRVERVAPASVRVGDLVTIQITVWSLKQIKRTLVTVVDNLPSSLVLSHRSPSLPVAPAYDTPIRTQYQLRALKRGIYRWNGAVVYGTDALGLVTKSKVYETQQADMTVLPRPIPLNIEFPVAAGWGVNESESGQTRGAGIEPRGVRQYHFGDSVRHIHWLSSARSQQLLVKEFEAGTQAAAAFCIQRGRGTDIGKGAASSLEQMCGNLAFLAETLLRQGAKVYLPGLDQKTSHHHPQERITEVYHVLASIEVDRDHRISSDLRAALGVLPPGSAFYVLVTVAEDDLPDTIAMAAEQGYRVVALLYDAAAFSKGRGRDPHRSAVQPDYVASIRNAGAVPIVVPIDLRAEPEV